MNFTQKTVVLVFLSISSVAALAASDAANGAVLYKSRCSACHSVEYNGIGPMHKEVFGRRAGQASGFAYSSAVKASKLVWTEATLDQWLTNPEKLIPGQTMGISVDEANERADLIAFLKKIGSKR